MSLSKMDTPILYEWQEEGIRTSEAHFSTSVSSLHLIQPSGASSEGSVALHSNWIVGSL